MSELLTDWFPPTTTPARKGTYQTCHDAAECKWPLHGYQYWDGKKWGAFNHSAHDAEQEKHVQTVFRRVHWRGLASKPKASKP